MNNQIVCLFTTAALTIAATSAYAATNNPKSAVTIPLKILSTDDEGTTRYKGKTVVSGKLKYNMVNEAGFPVEFIVDNLSKPMIPKIPKTNYPTEFAIETDNPQILKLKLNKSKCYLIPMTVEIDGYYSFSYEGGYDGANLIKIIKQGKPVLTSCNSR